MIPETFEKAEKKQALAYRLERGKQYRQAVEIYAQSIELFKFVKESQKATVAMKIKCNQKIKQMFEMGQRCKLLAEQSDRIAGIVSTQQTRNTRLKGLKPQKLNKRSSSEAKDQDSIKMERAILDALVGQVPQQGFDQIRGLDKIIQQLRETLVLPVIRPDLFTGIRTPAKGILLYGPPGNGKTMLARCVAGQCKSTFFNISSSTLVSKYVGDSQKMLKTLFQTALKKQPSIIFIDQIDSLLTKRVQGQQESTRRLKTQFLVRMDGFSSSDKDRVVLIAATNHQKEIDPAALRRFQKQIYIGPPGLAARLDILKSILQPQKADISSKEYQKLAKLLEGFSGADIKNICKEAAQIPLNEIPFQKLKKIEAKNIRSIIAKDIEQASKKFKSKK